MGLIISSFIVWDNSDLIRLMRVIGIEITRGFPMTHYEIFSKKKKIWKIKRSYPRIKLFFCIYEFDKNVIGCVNNSFEFIYIFRCFIIGTRTGLKINIRHSIFFFFTALNVLNVSVWRSIEFVCIDNELVLSYINLLLRGISYTAKILYK